MPAVIAHPERIVALAGKARERSLSAFGAAQMLKEHASRRRVSNLPRSQRVFQEIEGRCSVAIPADRSLRVLRSGGTDLLRRRSVAGNSPNEISEFDVVHWISQKISCHSIKDVF